MLPEISSIATVFIERVESVKWYSTAADQGCAFAVRWFYWHLNLAINISYDNISLGSINFFKLILCGVRQYWMNPALTF